MNQATLAFEIPSPALPRAARLAAGALLESSAGPMSTGHLCHGGTVDRTGFDIGWDHAHHGLVPPAELLLDGSPVGQGWLAGKAVYGNRTLAHKRCTRQCLGLRLLAWRQGLPWDKEQLTPNYLAQIQVTRCPVTRELLQGAAGQGDSLVVERLNPHAGFAAGNVAVMSLQAAQARHGLDVLAAVKAARALEAGQHHAVHDTATKLDAAAWWRLAALQAFTTPMPFAQAARIPLAVLPPNRVRVLNAVQGLQAVLTRSFMTPGWATRCRLLAQSLPQHSLRLDFNLFIGAMAPRVLEAGQDAAQLRLALEDAWLQERVQRRWLHLVLSLGEAGVDSLLERLVERGVGQPLSDRQPHTAGVRTLRLSHAQATESWSMAAA
jgi:hypothetical protein